MKIKKLYFTLLIPIAFIACYLLILLLDKFTLSDPSRIEKETGLSLPIEVRIIATELDRFSLTDGPNYAWLIQSNHDLVDWINKNMRLEGGPKLPSGGWAQVKLFGEVSSLAEDKIANLPLSGVWRSVQKNPNGKTETAYLFLAEGNKVALLRTFRP